MKRILEAIETLKKASKRHLQHRFAIFVAGGEQPLISFSDFARAERLALLFAGLTSVRMEVFDSEKEICYFIESSEAKQSFIQYRFPRFGKQKIKAASKKT